MIKFEDIKVGDYITYDKENSIHLVIKKNVKAAHPRLLKCLAIWDERYDYEIYKSCLEISYLDDCRFSSTKEKMLHKLAYME